MKELLDTISDYGIEVRRIFYTRQKVSHPSCVNQVEQKFENYADQSSDILQHSQNRPTGDRWLKF